MWDWRTGVPVSMLERNTRDALSGNAKDYFIDIPNEYGATRQQRIPLNLLGQKNVNTARFEMIPDMQYSHRRNLQLQHS